MRPSKERLAYLRSEGRFGLTPELWDEIDALTQENAEHVHAREAMREAMVGFRDERDRLAAALQEREATIRKLLAAIKSGPHIDGWPLEEWLEPHGVVAEAEAALSPKEGRALTEEPTP